MNGVVSPKKKKNAWIEYFPKIKKTKARWMGQKDIESLGSGRYGMEHSTLEFKELWHL